MTEREGTAQDFAELLGVDSPKAEPTPEGLEEVITTQPEPVVEEEPAGPSEEETFIAHLFRGKPGQEEWVRRLHVGDAE